MEIGGRRGELDAAVKLLDRGWRQMGGGEGGKARTRDARKSRAERDATADGPPSRSTRAADICYDVLFGCTIQFFLNFFGYHIFHAINAERIHIPIGVTNCHEKNYGSHNKN